MNYGTLKDIRSLKEVVERSISIVWTYFGLGSDAKFPVTERHLRRTVVTTRGVKYSILKRT
jgi:hypothetical protein